MRGVDPFAEVTDQAGPRPELGLLFVHGIGDQRQGETLTTWADAVVSYLRGSLGPESVTLGDAFLRPKPDDPLAPSHLDLEVAFPGAPEPIRWRIAEAWWAESFGPPRFRDLAFWAFLSLPYTVLAHVVSSFRRAWTGASRLPVRLARLLVPAIRVLLAVLLAPLMTLFVGIILLVGALPAARLRRLAGVVQRALSQSVGDSYVLLSSPAREAAIVHSVTSDLTWLAAGTERVVVVAHSQGAEVAHRAIRRLSTSNVAKLITLGSGQTKLFMAAKALETGSHRGVWLAPAGALISAAAIVVFFHTWRTENLEEAWGWFPAVLIGVGTFGQGLVLAGSLGRPRDAELDSGATEGWLDLYAGHDPVPNGPIYHLPDGRPPFVSTRQIDNRMSWLRDHTTYARNPEQVLAAIAEVGAAASGWSLDVLGETDAALRARAALRRGWRVGWLRASRWVAVGCGGALLVAIHRGWTDVHRPLLDALPSVTGRLPWLDLPPDWTRGDAATTVTATGLGLALALASNIVMSQAWAWWDNAERRDSCRAPLDLAVRAPYRFALFPSGLVVLMETMLAVVAVTVLLVSGGPTEPRGLAGLDLARLLLIPVIVGFGLLLIGTPLYLVSAVLERLHLVEPGRALPTRVQMGAIFVPYILVLMVGSILEFPEPPVLEFLLLLLAPFIVAFLGIPLLASSRLVRRALLPLRRWAHAPPYPPPSPVHQALEEVSQRVRVARTSLEEALQNDDQETWDQARARLISLAGTPRAALPDSVQEQLRKLVHALSDAPAASPNAESSEVRGEILPRYPQLVDQLNLSVTEWAAKHQPWPPEGRRGTGAILSTGQTSRKSRA